MREEKPGERRGETNDRFDFDPKKEGEMEGGLCEVFVEKKSQVQKETQKAEYKHTPTSSTVHVELELSASNPEPT